MLSRLFVIKQPFADVDGIKYVINFDYPNSSEDYIHRIGRTGRSKSKGTSYAFFTPSNSRQAKDLVSVLQEANQVCIFNQIFRRQHSFTDVLETENFTTIAGCN